MKKIIFIYLLIFNLAVAQNIENKIIGIWDYNFKGKVDSLISMETKGYNKYMINNKSNFMYTIAFFLKSNGKEIPVASYLINGVSKWKIINSTLIEEYLNVKILSLNIPNKYNLKNFNKGAKLLDNLVSSLIYKGYTDSSNITLLNNKKLILESHGIKMILNKKLNN